MCIWKVREGNRSSINLVKMAQPAFYSKVGRNERKCESSCKE